MSNATVSAPVAAPSVNVTYAPPAFPALEPFFAGNHQFAADRNASNPNYFPKLAEGQAPPLVWIGCADSRVPESVVLHQDPGQVFTTRNIANQFHADDWTSNAVIDYGVGHLNASHVAIVGHTHCGGVKAAYNSPKPDATTGQGKPDGHGHGKGKGKGKDKDCDKKGKGKGKGKGGKHDDHEEDEEDDEPAEDEALNNFLAPLITLRHSLPSTATVMDLTVENVKLGVATVVNSSAIQHAWHAGKTVCVHGWLFDIGTGLLTDIGVSNCGPAGPSH
ncbi:carbonic anhydrase [Cutaneotrichosporon oleaginosum]|uniref:Carbonic anhydrase n=1 Tax=Cutaneotrichosporon oleaginosum TaxID=879819 RepID=A0A0J0XUH4_9TREE|nr:carbonic anhydrase [Cutaneotrichosporon oleaginosum]KLT44728.1 carbonic anhydrase [Cutaneotrichosporon oleaginosum]TXT07714.1 hypothetical protein COLE_04638 [Cutaneotrichosporon oleaginosum]